MFVTYHYKLSLHELYILTNKNLLAEEKGKLKY